ncbi:MAG: thioredoxin domain-containing protein [Actinomycetota bacterium]
MSSTNRLAEATSPYLLQHAHNPVDWYPWGEAALSRAKAEDKPILLSVGYAACHWCHVMERESFEDDDTAKLMNEHFVSVKVDREERPDVDAIYMDAVQAMTGQGGWPMTVFLTPDGEPFYAGTYFPNEDRHGMPSFTRVLTAVAEAWRARRGELHEQGRRVVEGIGRIGALRESSQPLSDEALAGATRGLRSAFDAEWGGFGGAPKFPQPMTLEFLLRMHVRGDPDALDMVRRTLDRMAAGGVHDHVGGGFHRYAVDGRWHVPHFEKMLYDNAQLARLYTRAWKVTGDDRYRVVAESTLEYLLREMRHERGGFFSSQDADTDGVEGLTYTWRWDELVEIGSEPAAMAFGAVPHGNWEETNVLWRPLPFETIAAEYGSDPENFETHLEEARARLFEARLARPQPGLDDKVLAAWNGLAIAAFAEAGAAFDEPRYVEAAVAAARFVLEELREADGRLLRSWRDGRPGGPGYVDDHALMADACLALAEATLDARWILEAKDLADRMIALFHDADAGGFFQTGSDAEALVIRPKELFDNAVPSGNSVAADVLQRLALLFGEASYERAGVGALRLVRDLLDRSPTGFGNALCALDLYLSPAKEIAVVGDGGSAEARALAREVWSRFLPAHVLAAGPPEAEVTERVPLLAGRPLVDGHAAAYVCEHFMCRRPVTTPGELAAQLGS